METRVKARLIGALILVALIVLLVPEMLSGPHHDQNSSKEGSAKTYTIDLTAPAAPVTPNPTDSTAPPKPEPAAASADLPMETVDVESTSRPETPPPVEQSPEKASTSPSDNAGDAADSSAWVVQLGSFASQANAERLAGQLKSRGYKAFVSRLDSGSGTRYRVRVGPEQERAHAENLAERLRRDGRQAVVVPNS
jgi:DedD protein